MVGNQPDQAFIEAESSKIASTIDGMEAGIGNDFGVADVVGVAGGRQQLLVIAGEASMERMRTCSYALYVLPAAGKILTEKITSQVHR